MGARKLAVYGASVALLARRKDRLDAIAAECRGLAIETDVSSAGSLAAAAGQVRHRLGPVDLVVPNAGVLVTDPVLDASAERAAELVALYGATKAAVAHLALAMRAELAPAGVRMHDIEPAWTTTPLADAYAATLSACRPADPDAPRPLSRTTSRRRWRTAWRRR